MADGQLVACGGIGDVTQSGPAAKAGLERGDVVLQLNGQAVNGPDDLSVRVSQMAPGSVVHLRVFRNGQARDMDVTLGTFPENAETTQQGGQSTGESAAVKGLQVQNLTPDVAPRSVS